MSSRLQNTFARLRDAGEKAMGAFITNGFPHPSATEAILRVLDESGADFIELGMPFSDPLAEGVPIQRSSSVALQHGVKMKDAFRAVETFRQRSETPLLLMGYTNPILRYGVSNFCRDASSSGVDGLILPDLPPEEAPLVEEDARAASLGLVFLVAPNTKNERVRLIDELATAFVYAVTVTGLTGTEIGSAERVDRYLERLRTLVIRNPLLAGFGIKSHEDAVRYSKYTDGFIVGSAIIQHIESTWNNDALKEKQRLQSLFAFMQMLKSGNLTHYDQNAK